MTNLRGNGATSRQMLKAPPNSIFVWVNHDLSYPRNLAKFLGREDLEIVGPKRDLRGTNRTIIRDHAYYQHNSVEDMK